MTEIQHADKAKEYQDGFGREVSLYPGQQPREIYGWYKEFGTWKPITSPSTLIYEVKK